MKKLITVGLFTYQRPIYLERQLSFFKDLNFDYRLILLDGSDGKSFREQNKIIAKKYNAEYLNEIDLMGRHSLFYKNLDTEFSAWCADDDLIVPSFYRDGSIFLKENKDYAAVAGKVYTLEYDRSKTYKGYLLRNYLDNKYDILYGDLVEKMIRRDQSYGLGCPPTFYGVKRYEVVETFNKYISNIKLTTSMERLDEICTLSKGGIKVIDTFMGFRDYSSETLRFDFRDDPEQYISNEDTIQLQNAIRIELKEKIENKDLLEYCVGYAWPLPLRPPQGQIPDFKYTLKKRIESFVNLFMAHRFHTFDKTITKAMKRNMLEYSPNGSVGNSSNYWIVLMLFKDTLFRLKRAILSFIFGIKKSVVSILKSIFKTILPQRVTNWIKIRLKHKETEKLFIAGYSTFLSTGQTPHDAFMALINLYCSTNGNFSDAFNNKIKLTNPPVNVTTNLQGVLGKYSSADFLKVNAELNKNGYVHFDKKLSTELCKKIYNFALETSARIPPLYDTKIVYNPEKPLSEIYRFDIQDLMNNQDIQQLMMDPVLLNIARNYLGCEPIFDFPAMWWSTAFQKDASSEAAQLYHFDMDRLKWLKIFFYINDVTDENGPHYYIRGTHKPNTKPQILLDKGYARIKDEEIYPYYTPDDIIVVHGEAGSIFAGDTKCWHKGSSLKKGHRLVLEFEYTSSLFGANIPKLEIENVSEEFKAFCNSNKTFSSNIYLKS